MTGIQSVECPALQAGLNGFESRPVYQLGSSPEEEAPGFDPGCRRFDPYLPCHSLNAALAQLGRALPCHGKGRGFNPRTRRQIHPVSSAVERLPYKEMVEGSIPSLGTSFAPVAEWSGSGLLTRARTGSNPSRSTSITEAQPDVATGPVLKTVRALTGLERSTRLRFRQYRPCDGIGIRTGSRGRVLWVRTPLRAPASTWTGGAIGRRARLKSEGLRVRLPPGPPR